MFESLGNILKLGEELSATPKVQEVQRDRRTMGGIPARQNQHNWNYAIVAGKDGQKHLRLGLGERIFNFQAGDDFTEENWSAGTPVALKRLADLGHKDFHLGGDVLSKGVLQVHRSTPTEIHATMQDGKRNASFALTHVKGEGWTMVPRKPKPRLAVLAGQFIQAVSTEPKTAEVDPSLFEGMSDEQLDAWAAFGVGPRHKPREEKKHKCPKCGEQAAVWREAHADTGMDEMELRCRACGKSSNGEDDTTESCEECGHKTCLCKDKTAARKWDPWYGVDLDGTLAYAPEGKFLSTPGKPIKPMVERIEQMLADGKTVKIFTARAATPMGKRIVKLWLRRSGVPRSFEKLEITNEKDPGMVELFDDRVTRVERNTGKLAMLSNLFAKTKPKVPQQGKPQDPITEALENGITDLFTLQQDDKEAGFSCESTKQSSTIKLNELWKDNPAFGKYFGGGKPRYLVADVDPVNGRSKKAGDKFRMPENYDHIKDGDKFLPEGYELCAGANDWENCGWTWAGIHEKGKMDESGYYRAEPVAWLRVDHSNCSCKGEPGEGPGQEGKKDLIAHDEVMAWAKKQKLPKLNKEARPSYLSEAGAYFKDPGTGVIGAGVGMGMAASQLMRNNEGVSPLAQLGQIFGAGAIGYGAGHVLGTVVNPALDRVFDLPPKSEEEKVADLRSELRGKIKEQRTVINSTPTNAQMAAGNYAMGHVWIQGFDITIENAKGSIRFDRHNVPPKWKTLMKNDYGYVRSFVLKGRRYFTRSTADGDHVDIFLGPHPDSGTIYVVDQYINGKFDEHKCMLGFVSEAEAKAAYLANYQKGWKGLGDVTPLTIKQFKRWLKSGDTGRPLAGQQMKDFSKHADFLETMENSPYVNSLPLSVGLGTLRGAAMGALIAGGIKAKRKFYGEPDNVSMRKALLLGSAIGAGTGALTHWTPPLVRMVRGMTETDKVASHFMDAVTAPAWLKPAPAGILLGGLYGAGAGMAVNGLRQVKRKIMGQDDSDVSLAQGALNGGLIGMAGAGVMQMAGQNDRPSDALVETQLRDNAKFVAPDSAELPDRSKLAFFGQTSGLAASIVGDPMIPPWRQAELLRELERAKAMNVALTPSQLMMAGLVGLAGWLTAKASGAGAFGQAALSIGGAMLGGVLGTSPSTQINGDGFYRP